MEVEVPGEVVAVIVLVAWLIVEVEALVLGEMVAVQMLAVAMQLLVVGVSAVAAALVAGMEVQEVETPVVGVVVVAVKALMVVVETPVAGESALPRKKVKVDVGGGREVMQQVIQYGAVARRTQKLVKEGGDLIFRLYYFNQDSIFCSRFSVGYYYFHHLLCLISRPSICR